MCSNSIFTVLSKNIGTVHINIFWFVIPKPKQKGEIRNLCYFLLNGAMPISQHGRFRYHLTNILLAVFLFALVRFKALKGLQLRKKKSKFWKYGLKL